MLKSLELHGFKTFAGKTQFAFGDGITAIVGPNGSGKSNLADAIRWILGEQRPALLRARKGEDIVFNGTERRARMGMAQGMLTLDNRARLLPIDFGEVVIGRRVFRSGDSEYLINGNRVRLRDVQELLAHAGVSADSYVVIGQGLVDAALSLRAEERRQLFEDAAGLGAYQGKRDEALRRLTQTDEHLTRVRDIVAEIEPRLKRLKRQAERASEYRELITELQELLRQQYGYRWGVAVHALSQARQALEAARLIVNSAGDDVRDVGAQLDSLRQQQQRIRATIAARVKERDELRAASEAFARERAVAEERERGLERERGAFRQEEALMRAEITTARGALEAHEQEGQALREQWEGAGKALDEARAALKRAETERAALRQRAEEMRRAVGRLTGRFNEEQQRQGSITERMKTLSHEREAQERQLHELAGRIDFREQEVKTLEAEAETLTGQRAELAEERQRLNRLRQESLERERAAQSELHETQRRLTELQTRQELLARLRAEGTGYESGVRALLRAEESVRATIAGPVAEMLRVPEELSTAIGAALAETLQALVIKGELTAAREWIHAREEGRVTLLPAEWRERLLPPAVGAGAGIIGRGAELVESQDAALLEQLLGDWLIVREWEDIRHLAGAEQWNLVTLDGQVRLKDGAVRAGKGTGNSRTLLAQSREWATLPKRLAAARGEQDARYGALEGARARLRENEEALQKAERDLADAGRHIEKTESVLHRERRDLEKLRQEREWRQGLVAKSLAEGERLGAEAAALAASAATVQGERAAAETELRAQEERIATSRPDGLRRAAEEERTRLAVLEEQIAGWKRAGGSLVEALNRLEQRELALKARGERMESEAAALRARLASLNEAAQEAKAKFEGAEREISPLEKELAANEQAMAALEEELQTARRRRHEQDEQLHTAQLDLRGAEERLAHLKEQIESDLGMVGLSYVQEDETLIQQSVLPLEELVTSLPKVVELRDGLENDVRRLRRRVGMLGAVNPDAPAEYTELDERFTFLSEQSRDLEKACTDLRRIVHDLDVIMRERFITTFHAVEKAFRDYFARLFGGGQARIELSDPDNPTTSGVEIIARPPGKRAQSIALLSGGERALTAAALIFAILKVSPAPFCVLDEVDAMLDEANVGRFRDMLLEHSDHTQFIVVTHNRGTIEAARTIYGISQSDPGISEVISLHLEEAVRLSKH